MNSAVFVDFENLYLSLKHRTETAGLRTRELALQILEGLMQRLRDNGKPMVLGRSYSAFDTYPGVEVAHDLALMGLEPQYVLISHSGKNSADVQLALDVSRVVFRRPEIQNIVIVSGDRDFIPLARQVLEEDRELCIVGIPATTSGDLRARVGDARFWDALELLPDLEERVAEAQRNRESSEAAAPDKAPVRDAGTEDPAGSGSNGVIHAAARSAEDRAAASGQTASDRSASDRPASDRPASDQTAGDQPASDRADSGAPVPAAPAGTEVPPRAPAIPADAVPAVDARDDAADPADLAEEPVGAKVIGHIPVTWRTNAEHRPDALEQCVGLLLRARNRHGSNDIWLSPFLKGPMSQHFSHLVHPERRALINELRSRGVVRVEERENQYAEYPYSVLVIEDEHPMVRGLAERT